MVDITIIEENETFTVAAADEKAHDLLESIQLELEVLTDLVLENGGSDGHSG